MEFRLAQDSDRNQLMDIFRVSFGEPEESLNYFFNKKFKNDKCVVCVKDDKILASLSMLDTELVSFDGLEKAHYIYGAATHPIHRKNGYMSRLIDYANMLALDNGHRYSILLPATDKLYDYYQKLGYKKFFKVQYLNINKREILKYINDKTNPTQTMSFDNMNNLRFNICNEHVGSAMWDADHMEYAVTMNDVYYGGKTIFSSEGYAVSYVSKDNVLQIIEFMVTEKDFKNLISLIYEKYPDVDSYNFRLPLFNNHFGIDGKISYFGMIKPLDGNSTDLEKLATQPYLGLALD